MLKLISKHTLQIFFVYLTLAAVIVLSVNTYLLIQNQTRILENQNKAIPVVNDTNQKITQIGENLAHLSEKIK